MEYALSALVTLTIVVVLLRRPIKRGVNQLFTGAVRESDDELQMIIARERARMREEAEAASSEVGEAKISKSVGGKRFFAHVRVRCRAIGHGSTTICVLPTAAGDWDCVEEWNTAATRGVAIGLSLADETADCEITLVRGTTVDTVDSAMAIAGVRAVWQAIAFRPPAALYARLEAALVRCDQLTVADLEVELRSGPKAGRAE